MFQYTGTLPPQNLAFNVSSLTKEYNRLFNNLKNQDPNMSQNKAEEVFLKFIKEKVNIDGLETYKVTADSAKKIEYDPSTKTVITAPCP
ncbi:hypothetical protein [Chryseobacterium sp. 5_R23647]|uniref:hypothetical protein n=1 Tax=Chryseobacterium sp. 5_R23647 TaxID=2258964 RepID=UPI000E269547|nr:hypothetical protein [Chryseobacterium sp. 5_R23647]REC43984.1 hypothetical protein DRF69_07135 [Chryseobacterium sp. 5_R23647]